MKWPSPLHRSYVKTAGGILRLVVIGLLILTAILLAFGNHTRTTAAETTRPPYLFSIDTEPLHVGGASIAVLRDLSWEMGMSLRLAGWLATDEGVSAYQYLWAPVGGMAEWQTVQEPQIFNRKDLAAAGIGYRSGHETAGFDFTLSLPTDVEAGYYNLFVRAVDGMGNTCDMIAALNIRYGNADEDDGTTCTVNFARLLEESKKTSILRGGAEITAEGILLPAGGSVRLGDYMLAGCEQLLVTVATEGAADADGRRAVIGLKSGGTHSFGQPGERYNMTDALVYAPLSDKANTLSVDLSACDYGGEVWLTAYTDTALTVTEVRFVYNGYATDRVAAKIRFSADTISYFSGANHVVLSGVRDPALGDVLRIEVSEDTNDPFIHFYAERLMAEADIRLSADNYRYMVILARMSSENLRNHTAFYLCAGNITSASERCTCSFQTTNDGRWHYYLVDLTEKDTWTGRIHGWRFDIINGDSVAGNYMDVASVQFFRTEKAAQAAASRDPAGEGTYTLGEPAVIRDMSEEIADDGFAIDPEDAYVVETEPPETDLPESGTAGADPEETTAPHTEETGSEIDTTPQESETEPPAGGCSSGVGTAMWLILIPAALVRPFKKIFHTQKEESHEET